MQPRVSERSELRLVHALTPCGPIPTALTPDGVYPYESFCATAPRGELRRVRVAALENEFVYAEVSADLGGKLVALHAVEGGRRSPNVLADPGVVRPCRILPRGAFVGGGIEVSFPISHTPSLLERVECATGERGGRAFVAVGERELRSGMHWSVEWSLGAGERFLTQRTRLRNPSRDEALPWMSWSNAGVPSAPDSEFVFPGGPVLVHGDFCEQNIVVDEDGKPFLIDFERVGMGNVDHDLARTRHRGFDLEYASLARAGHDEGAHRRAHLGASTS